MANNKNITFNQLEASMTKVKAEIDKKANTNHGTHVPTTGTANNATYLRNDNQWHKIVPSDIGAAPASHGDHVTYSKTSPLAPGTASAGSAANVSRGDHVHPLQTSVSGNAGTATKLATARTLTIGNTGKNFDGSGNVSWSLDEIGAVSPSHTHDRIVDSNNSIIVAQANDHCGLDTVNNVNVATWYGFSISNNCSNTDNYGQVTFSVDARSGQVWTRGTINAPAFSGALYGNANTATTLANSRKFTIGNAERYFNGSADVSWSLDEMGVTSAIQVAENDVKMDIHHNYVSKHEVAHYFEGENKWKLDVYSLGSMSASAYPTKETMIQNNCQYQRSYLVEHPSYSGDSYGNNYVGYATTYIHFTEDYQWTGRVITDDNGTVYLNDALVLSTTTCQWADITLNFKAGWNKVEVLYAEGIGGDGWQFDPEIVVVPGGVMNKMNCYGQNSTEEYLKANYSTTQQMNSSIEQKANEITSSVSSMYSTKTETDDKIHNVRVGGTNLFRSTANLDSKYWASENASLTDSYYRGSRIYRVSYAWADYNYPVRYLFEDDVIELNTEYTFSCYARTNNDGYRPNLCIYGDSAHMEGHGLHIGTVTTEWRQYSGKIKFHDGDRSYPLRIEPTTESGDNNIYIEVCGLKLEKGNKATDWSPNPNDTDIVNPNLLRNGRFKGLLNDTINNVPGWEALGELKVWRDIGQPGYNKYGCIYFYKDVCDGAGCYLYQDLDMDDIGRNVPLTLSFDAWREGTISEVGCNVEYFNADKSSMLASKSLNANDFNGHRSYTFVTLNDVNAKYLRVVFYYISVNGATGGYLATIGNVKLEHGMCETAWSQSQHEDITVKFSEIGGGYNLLRNSSFKKNLDYWGIQAYNDPQGGSIGTTTSSNQWGFPDDNVNTCVIKLSNQENVEYGIGQSFSTAIGKKYTVSFYCASHRMSKATIVIRKPDGNWLSGKQFVPNARNGGNADANNWVIFTHTFTATHNYHAINIVVNAAQDDGYMWIAKPMVCEGELLRSWSPHPSEIYDGITQIDKDGIKVLHDGIDGNSYTHMSPTGFYLNNKGTDIFKVDGNGLYIKGNGDFTGKVTANDGSIGGFTISSGKLVGTGGNGVGMSGNGDDWAFWAGSNTGGNAPFHVGHEGHLYATNATLAGTLDGNATTASRLQSARTLTIGNTGKNFDGTGNISWSLDEIGAAPSSHGHNFMYVKGTNTIGSVNDDTTGNWGAQGNSVHWYAGVGGLLHDQPNEWGYLLNIGQGAEVHQVWMTQASGNLYHRGGNGSGWSGSWKTILDSDNYSTWAAAKNHTHNYAASNHTHNYAASNHNHDSAYLKLSGGTLSGQLTVNNNVSSQGFCVSKNNKEVWLDIGDNDTYIWASGANKSLQITHGGDLNFDGKPVLYGGRGNNYDTATGTIYFNNAGTSHKGRVSCYNNSNGDYVQLALRNASDGVNYLNIYDSSIRIGCDNIYFNGKKFTIAASAPSNPANGDVWINIG